MTPVTTAGTIDDLLLGTDHAGEALRVGDFRAWGYWTFLRLKQPTELGTLLARILEEPSEDELRHAEYSEIKPESIAEIKRAALASGLDPSAVLSAELARADEETERSTSVDKKT